MRLVYLAAWGAIAWMFYIAASCEVRGEVPRLNSLYGVRYSTELLTRAEHPERFRSAMFYLWGEPCLAAAVLYVTASLGRRRDLADPLAPGAPSTAADAELSAKLAQEEARRWKELRS